MLLCTILRQQEIATGIEGQERETSRGSILMTLIVAMVLMGTLGVAVFSLNSTGMLNFVSYNNNQNAYYLAEAGLRYASTVYKNTDNTATESDDLNADDDKRDVLENELNGCTYNMPDNRGHFSLKVRPYWLYAKTDFKSKKKAVLCFPGTIPDNFDIPSSGKFFRYDKNNESATTFTYSNAVVDLAQNSLNCTVYSNIESDDMIYLAFPVSSSQTVQAGGDIILTMSEADKKCVPERNGYFEILQGTSLEPTRFFYERAVIDGKKLTLKKIFKRDFSEFTGPSLSSSSHVIIKKNLILESIGNIGSNSFGSTRKLNYAIPVTDSVKGAQAETISFTTTQDLKDNFDSANGEGMKVSKYTTAGGQSLFATMTSIPTVDGRKLGTFLLNKKSMINEAWEKNGYLLDYDVQVKLSNGVDLDYGGEGLSVRMSSSNGDYASLGVSMMKFSGYFSNSITYNPTVGSTPSDGDTIEAWYDDGYWSVRSSRRTWHEDWKKRGSATILGDVETVTGSNRKLITLTSVTGSFSVGDTLKINGTEIGTVTAKDFQSDDMIPDEIKPSVADKDLTDELLLVLWEQTVDTDGSIVRRWLAYKELPSSYDPYIQGGQDSYYDGQIVHDNTTLLVRIREDYQGSGDSKKKVNKINVFYGDMYDKSSSKIAVDHSSGNSINYDIIPRNRYVYGEPVLSGAWNPLWPPRRLVQWSSDCDYFSHVQNGTDAESSPGIFQWDGLNDATDVQDISVFELSDDGTITISELTTPESDDGPYKEPEIGMHAFGDVYDGNSGNFKVASFNDFALLLFTPGYEKGGFLSAVQY